MSQFIQRIAVILDRIQFALIFYRTVLATGGFSHPALLSSRRRRSPAQFTSPQALENGRHTAFQSHHALHPFHPLILLPVALTPVGGAFREELHYEAYAADEGEIPRQRVVDWWNTQ